MIKFWFLGLSTILLGCKSFDKLSKKNEFGVEDGYVKYSNSAYNLRALTFGDFQFASTLREFRKLKPLQRSSLSEILLYAKTDSPSYEYYIVTGKVNSTCTEVFTVKDTILNNRKISILISKNAPQKDKEFIFNNIFFEP